MMSTYMRFSDKYYRCVDRNMAGDAEGWTMEGINSHAMFEISYRSPMIPTRLEKPASHYYRRCNCHCLTWLAP
jgi:hypothetical protein